MRRTASLAAATGAAAMIAFANPAAAQSASFLALSDLKTLFVTQQQYFILDTEQSMNASLNHFHITQLDTTTGNFTGTIWAPIVPPYGSIPQLTLPVTGTIALDAAQFGPSYSYGNFYGITFTWQYTPNECETEIATYTGAISFLGYQGSGKMHAAIGGTVATEYGGCLVGGFDLGPVPFSGVLTK
ncbi:MAG: hypothetical protein WDN69_12505 [Aliidongia sp.]